MKKLFLVLIVLISCATMNAQSSTQVATLKHDSTLSVFYGVSAFVDAYNAAAAGDVITLSKGSFTSTNISKNLTIIGDGMEQNGTLICGSLTNYSDSIILEGIKITDNFNVSSNCNISMSHVSTDRLSLCYNGNLVTGKVVNCRIKNLSGSREKVSFLNCYIQGAYSSSTNNSYFNCIAGGYNMSGFFENCILFYTRNSSGSYPLFNDATTKSNNCVFFKIYNYTTPNTPGNHNNLRNVNTDIFANYENIGNDLSYQSFELTESARTTYLGSDSTEVGWYGGYVPFTRNAVPRISNLSVSRSTTADGQLSVSVTVDDGITNDEE